MIWCPVPGRKENGALLGDLLTILLAPYADMGAFSGRVRVSVPRMSVGEVGATTLAMIVYELATNSMTYGALSSATGTLAVSSVVEADDVILVWTERGGPAVAVPDELPGFGSKLLQRSVTSQLKRSVHHNWSAEGAITTLRMDGQRLSIWQPEPMKPGCGAAMTSPRHDEASAINFSIYCA